MRPPVVLDVDGSVGRPPGAVVLPLPDWGERLRFACGRRTLAGFAAHLTAALPAGHGPVLLGSGDFHHLSRPLIERAAAAHGPLDVVVFDNHPDNMRFPFAVHCGSWVSGVAALPQVRHVHVVGITSADIGPAHAWENRLWPLFRRRLTYWSLGVPVGWTHALGLAPAFRRFADVDGLLAVFAGAIGAHDRPLYLSIDKDVLSPVEARTNWDQGVLREAELHAALAGLGGRIVAADITGEVSQPRYRQRWKRLLAALDRQPAIAEEELAGWQSRQHALNERLLATLEKAWAGR